MVFALQRSSTLRISYDFPKKTTNIATLDLERTAFQGFSELSKTERDLSSPNGIFTDSIGLIRQKNIEFCGLLFHRIVGGGPRLQAKKLSAPPLFTL